MSVCVHYLEAKMDVDDPATLASEDSLQKTIRLPTPVPPSVSFPYSYDEHRDQQTPLIIDNGSTYLRYGFATSSTPRTGLNVVAKYKERKSNKPLLLFGEGIDAESGARSQAKMPWEGDVLLNFDALVCLWGQLPLTGIWLWMLTLLKLEI